MLFGNNILFNDGIHKMLPDYFMVHSLFFSSFILSSLVYYYGKSGRKQEKEMEREREKAI